MFYRYNDFSSSLHETLHLIDKPMIEQKELLEVEFNMWKGDFEQIDDILVMGIKI